MPICLNKLIDTCSTCNENGKNFCPNPEICTGTGTNPRHCILYVLKCGHIMHSHCLRDEKNCPMCRTIIDVSFTPAPQYVWSSGLIEPETHSRIQIKENESGGKWIQKKLINLIELIQNRQPIAPYIYENISRRFDFSDPIMYQGIIKKYEDEIKH
jgi:hypothetical protein